MTLKEIARALGGKVYGNEVRAPAPGHSIKSQGLCVRLSDNSPSGFSVVSYSGESWQECHDYVCDRLGLPRYDPSRPREAAPKKPAPAPKSTEDDAARMARARAIWSEGRDPAGTIVEHYLAGRGLALPENAADVFRYNWHCPWREDDQTIFVPAMIAPMRSIATNEITGLHRTRLTAEGAKVDRRMLGIAGGAAIKIDADAEVTTGLAIGEGVETVLAARQLGFRPAWALASAGAMAAFPVLAGIEALTLLAENDQASERAICQCAERWHAAGREIVIVDPVAGDMNDAIRSAAA